MSRLSFSLCIINLQLQWLGWKDIDHFNCFLTICCMLSHPYCGILIMFTEESSEVPPDLKAKPGVQRKKHHWPSLDGAVASDYEAEEAEEEACPLTRSPRSQSSCYSCCCSPHTGECKFGSLSFQVGTMHTVDKSKQKSCKHKWGLKEAGYSFRIHNVCRRFVVMLYAKHSHVCSDPSVPSSMWLKWLDHHLYSVSLCIHTCI